MIKCLIWCTSEYGLLAIALDAFQLFLPRLTFRVRAEARQAACARLSCTVPGGLVLEVQGPGAALAKHRSYQVVRLPRQALGQALAMEFVGLHGGRLELEPQTSGALRVRLRLGQDHATDKASASRARLNTS